MNRRVFITSFAWATVPATLPTALSHVLQQTTAVNDEQPTRNTLARIVNAAQMGEWGRLPIGDRIVKIAMLLLDTPYVGGTLEGEPEECRVTLEGLDCVTFFEVSLCIARMMERGNTSLEALRAEITYTRYRGGILGDYTSRLHYTADWINDNVKKFVVSDITQKIGGQPVRHNVSFMSKNPAFYGPLQRNPNLIPVIRGIEEEINKRTMFVIPKEKVKNIESLLESGDIIAVATNKTGLDYAHTGLIAVINGRARFLHASTTQKKVVLDDTISAYLNTVKSHTGITVVRPLATL